MSEGRFKYQRLALLSPAKAESYPTCSWRLSGWSSLGSAKISDVDVIFGVSSGRAEQDGSIKAVAERLDGAVPG